MTTPTSYPRKKRNSKSKQDFEWIGEGVMMDGKLQYQKCRIRGETVCQNDYVLINTTNNTSVGKVFRFHDLGNYPDPHRAEIQWLYKYDDLTKKCRDQLKKQNNELFLPVCIPDEWPIQGSIEVVDAETIIQLKKVTFLHPKENIPVVKTCSDDGPFYVKYAFDVQDCIYYATEYLSRLKSALEISEADVNNNRCRTPRSTHSATPNNRTRSPHGKCSCNE